MNINDLKLNGQPLKLIEGEYLFAKLTARNQANTVRIVKRAYTPRTRNRFDDGSAAVKWSFAIVRPDLSGKSGDLTLTVRTPKTDKSGKAVTNGWESLPLIHAGGDSAIVKMSLTAAQVEALGSNPVYSFAIGYGEALEHLKLDKSGVREIGDSANGDSLDKDTASFKSESTCEAFGVRFNLTASLTDKSFAVRNTGDTHADKEMDKDTDKESPASEDSQPADGQPQTAVIVNEMVNS